MTPERIVELLEGSTCALLRGSQGVYVVETPTKELWLTATAPDGQVEALPIRISGPEALLGFERVDLTSGEVHIES